VHVDVAFWGGVVPGNTAHLEPLIDAGVRGFKCFLAPSGVDEFRHVGEKELREAMPILARRNVPLLVHAEDPTLLLSGGDDVDGAAVLAGPDYASYVASRPAAAERSAVELMIRLAREYGTEVHIVHVTCREAVAAIERAKAAGVRITAESCPHYLTFAAAEIPAGATEFKCAPPIRDGRDRDALWKALRSGALDLVVTDHSPAPRELKATGDFRTAWGGIASLELSLPAVWTGVAQQLAARASSSRSRSRSRRDESGMRDAAPARRRRRPSATERALVSLARWMSEAPARLAKLGACKGCIAEGYDGDLVVWDPEREWIVDPSRLQQRHKITPYAGRLLRGVVCASYVRGRPVWSDGALRTPCAGDLL
jgi:allantoinase